MIDGAVLEVTPAGGRVVKLELPFVPTPKETVVTLELHGHVLLIDDAEDAVLIQDELSSAIWRRFDGKTSLETIIEALAEEFPDNEELEYDVWDLTEEFANDGLLAGVSELLAPPAGTGAQSDPVVPVGGELEEFRLPDLEGAEVGLADLRGRQVVLVNWAPSCGYCRQIAPELAGLESALVEQGAELVFLASGEADKNRELRDEHSLKSPILLLDGNKNPFGQVGTPVAYLLDEEGKVAAPRATGAVAVPELVRQAAGVESASNGSSPAAETKQRVPASFGRLGEPRTQIQEPEGGWRSPVAYELGTFAIGVRSDTLATEELVARLLSEYPRAEGIEDVPANYSVALGEEPTRPSRALRRVYQADTTLVRSRSSRRVLLGLAQYLSEYVPGGPPELVLTDNLAAVVDGQALLLPPDVADKVEELEPRLTKLGVRLVDEQYASLSLETGELVVLEPRLTLDSAVLDELEGADPSWVEPGRYPLRAWFMRESDFDDEPPSRAYAVYVAFERTMPTQSRVLEPTVTGLDALLDRVDVEVVPDGGVEPFVAELKRYLAKS
jgi:cytochrome c biogenesis protein CcmG/thiol:disulfide interchange protein DsbE